MLKWTGTKEIQYAELETSLYIVKPSGNEFVASFWCDKTKPSTQRFVCQFSDMKQAKNECELHHKEMQSK